MSGTRRIVYTLGDRHVDTEDESVSYWINRLANPILRALLNLGNRLASDVVTVTEDTTLTGKEGAVLADASAGAVTITLCAPEALYHPLIVQKKDSSGNAVTVACPGATTINGAASSTLPAQYDRLTIVADDSAFYA